MSNVATGLPVVFYTYVTPGVEPPQPEEGETWFDTSANESKVYDGAGWTVQNIESHRALSGINPDDHHTRYSDSEAESAAPVQSVNGQTGAVQAASYGEKTVTCSGGGTNTQISVPANSIVNCRTAFGNNLADNDTLFPERIADDTIEIYNNDTDKDVVVRWVS